MLSLPLRIRLNNQPRFHYCEPGWRWSPPPLPDWDLWCVREGEGAMRIDGDVYPLAPNVCFVVPPGATPAATQNPQRRLVVFAGHFTAEGEGELPPMPPPGMALRQRAAFFWSLAERCAECAARDDALGQAQSRLFMEQMLLHLWEEARTPAIQPGDERLRDILRAIREAPGEGWTVDAQAERACLSRSQYTRRFQRLTGGVSPTQYVVRARLERACQLIRETDMTLTQIAEALGYRDLFYFSRQFKAYYGHAPSALRVSGAPLTQSSTSLPLPVP